MKLDILAFAAHPDDVELSCSGTLLRHIEQGKSVGLVDLTQGELGTRGTPQIRAEEAEKAAQLMGASLRLNLGLADGFFDRNPDNLRRIAQVVRIYQPEIVLANALSDRHPDHGRAAKLVSDACFIAGLAKVETHYQAGGPQERWRPKAVYHYIQDHNLKPDFVVDISKYMDRKIELVMAFRSQFFDPKSAEPDTPISGSDFIEFLRAKARTYGRSAGFEFAEGFNVTRTPGVRDLFALS